MLNFKRGLKDKSQWLVHQDLIKYCEGITIRPIHVLNERKGCGVLFPRRVYTITSVVVFLFPSEGLHYERVKVVLFFCNEAVGSLGSYNKLNWLPFCEVFYPQVGFTPWPERIVARFRIEESCFEFGETEWIIMQNMELGGFSSSRYSSWSERYFLLKYDQEDKEQAAQDLMA